MSGDHPDYSITEIGQNTEKSPGDLRRLAVTQGPVGRHQLRLVWVIRGVINDKERPSWSKKTPKWNRSKQQ